MKSFKFFKSELIDQAIVFDEALTPNQRFKRKIHFARSKPKRVAALRRNKMRSVPTGGNEALRQQSRRKFLQSLKLRVRKDLSASKLQKQSPGQKQQIEKLVDRLKKNPAQQAKMKAFTRPGGKMYRDLIAKRKERIKKMREKK